MSTPEEVLKTFWGYDTFRSPQDDIIQAHLSGQDVLALLPTGAGKSVCYQIPALMHDGLCLVVSPLIALMKDQVQQLRKRGIRAGAIFSGLKEAEIDGILNNCAVGHYKLLYVSPERLGSDRFLTALRGLPVSMLAIDEAHCISQWGFDFRPSYRDIVLIRDLFPHVPIMALTASATPEVQEDIVRVLGFRKPYSRFMSTFERSNIGFAVRQDVAKPEKMLEILNKVEGTAIIYARNRKKTEDIARFLQKNNISATFYHAGLQHQERSQRQEAWIANKFRVMACTNAFGMGIDKPDVRLVIHVDLPDSLEAYYQEAGRAGRDGNRSYAVLLCNKEDKDNLLQQEQQRFPDLSIVKQVYNALFNHLGIAFGGGKRHSFEFNMYAFAKKHHWDTLMVFNVLKLLEQSGYLQMSDAFYLPSRVSVIMDKGELYRFQVAHPGHDAFIKLLLRTYEGVIGHFVKINELHLAGKMNVPLKEVTDRLKVLDKCGVLTYIQSSDSPRITFLEERVPEDHIRLDMAFIAFTRQQMRSRMDAMLDYTDASTDQCRQTVMRRYFGETSVQPCGKCDLCLNRKQLEDAGTIAMQNKILHALEQSSYTQLSIPVFISSISHNRKEQYLETFRMMLDEGILKWVNEQKQIVGK